MSQLDCEDGIDEARWERLCAQPLPIELAEARIRRAYRELHGCEPGVVWTREQAWRLLREDLLAATTAASASTTTNTLEIL